MTSFWKNRKTLRLRSKLGNDALWLVPRLWSYAAENQPDGNLSDYSAEELAMLLEYSGDAKAMLQAMLQASFIDEDMRLHGWEEHNGFHKTFASRASTAAKARWEKEKAPAPKKKGSDKKGDEMRQALLDACLKHPALSEVENLPLEWASFVDQRSAKKAPLTFHTAELLVAELSKRPAQIVAGLQVALMQNWTGFKWSWYDRHVEPLAANGHTHPSAPQRPKLPSPPRFPEENP